MTAGVVQATVGIDCGGLSADPAEAQARARTAADALRVSRPAFSAATPMPRWQAGAVAVVAAAVPAALIASLNGTHGVMDIVMAIPFLAIIIVRLFALWHIARPSKIARAAPPISDARHLPEYSVLVPLFREAEIVPALVQALARIEYPADKLEILFVTEARDEATRAALQSSALSSHMRVLTVPAGSPQTKPRALNYALQSARGALICVFDAEDVPSPRQLLQAAESFASQGDDLVCLQARLGIYNTDHGFLQRHFSLEYAALFEAILPALVRLGIPIPLGGTSNHFRRTALDAVGGWDAYNVTEDADLGIRLARHGLCVEMLASDTWEEAPANWTDWRGQRTRWLKGWMQTYLVHMRDPRALVRDLGLWRAAGVQIMLGGMILSALIHPWFYGAAALAFATGVPVFGDAGICSTFCWATFAAGYASGILLGLVAAWRSEGRIPLVSAVFVPIYWLAITYAAYRALWQLRTRPYFWEKTPHAARPLAAAPPNTPVTVPLSGC